MKNKFKNRLKHLNKKEYLIKGIIAACLLVSLVISFFFADKIENAFKMKTTYGQNQVEENALKTAENYINTAFVDKKLYNIGGYVYSNYALTQLVKNWFGENDIPSNESKNQEIVYRFIKAVKELKK